MTIEKILSDKAFELPFLQNDNESFDKFITQLLENFLSKVDQIKDGFESFGVDDIKEVQKKTVIGLLSSVKEYYAGNPNTAYSRLDEILKNNLMHLSTVFKHKVYGEEEDFYRIRIKEWNYPLSKKELFHIPFELRGRVKTQRYSIPGFPSLYIGKTLYVCWEELNRPPIDKIHVIRLQSARPMKFLDLTAPISEDGNTKGEYFRYFMTFPLIACCSVKVKNPSDSFKPEYIIPQLLLQWIRNNEVMDGIQYQSTHIGSDIYKQEGQLANLVLPVKENKNNGHCSNLKSTFKMTEVISKPMYKLALGGQIFINSAEDNYKIDAKLPYLELIKGIKYPYSYSELGDMERYLNGMQAEKIE